MFLLTLILILSSSLHEPDENILFEDLIHSDLPLWAYDAENVWPRNYYNDDEIGCAHIISMGDWKFNSVADDTSWFRIQNYGAFHCYMMVQEAREFESLGGRQARYGYIVDLGKTSRGDFRLWTLQLGGRPGSDYIFLRTKVETDNEVTLSFDVLQRRCPDDKIRVGPELDILDTRYCAINSREGLKVLAEAMSALPILGKLEFTIR